MLRPNVELAKYVTVGGLTAALYFFVLFIAFDVAGFSEKPSVSLAYGLSTAFHFLANKLFTFGRSDKTFVVQLARYLCVVLVNYLITMLVVHAVVDLGGQSPYLAVAVAVAATVAFGYAMTKLWVFQRTRG